MGALDSAWRTGPRVGEIGEFAVIAHLRRLIASAGGPLAAAGAGGPLSEGAVRLGVGDDAAILRPSPGAELAWTCDMQIAGRHFVPRWMTPRQVGARAAEVNLSDLAAMGARPLAALLSLGLPRDLHLGALEEIYQGLCAAFGQHGAVIAGGNITRSDTLLLDVSLIGEVETGLVLRRSAARAGDLVFVTGRPGRAAAALALRRAAERADARWDGERDGALLARLWPSYADPRARVTVGRHLVANGLAAAVIDQSDGLVGDLTHICAESGVGIVLHEDWLPPDEDLALAARTLGGTPQAWLLGASDDYELLLAVPRSAADTVFAIPAATGVTVAVIGEVVAGPGTVLLMDAAGELSRPPGGWDHLRDG